MKPSPPLPKATEQFSAYVRELNRLLRSSKHRVPRSEGADLGAELESLQEQVRAVEAQPSVTDEAHHAALGRGLIGSASSVDREAVFPATPVAPLTVGIPSPRPASGLGIQAMVDAWPTSRQHELKAFADRMEAVMAVFVPAGDVLRSPGIDALVSRVDLAVRYASALLYQSARRAGIPEDVIDRAAMSASRTLSERLFGSSGRVYSVGRGLYRESEQELVGPVGPGGRVRPTAFGLRDEGGAVVLKASVEADASTGGTS